MRRPSKLALSDEKRRLLDALRREHGLAATAAIPRRPDEDRAPTTSTQERLWFLDRLNPGSPAYNVPVVLCVSGALDVDALGRAIATLVERHEALRTSPDS